MLSSIWQLNCVKETTTWICACVNGNETSVAAVKTECFLSGWRRLNILPYIELIADSRRTKKKNVLCYTFHPLRCHSIHAIAHDRNLRYGSTNERKKEKKKENKTKETGFHIGFTWKVTTFLSSNKKYNSIISKIYFYSNRIFQIFLSNTNIQQT